MQNGGEPQTFTLVQERPSFHPYWEFHQCSLLQPRITILHSIQGLLERVIETVLRKVLTWAWVTSQNPVPCPFARVCFQDPLQPCARCFLSILLDLYNNQITHLLSLQPRLNTVLGSSLTCFSRDLNPVLLLFPLHVIISLHLTQWNAAASQLKY